MESENPTPEQSASIPDTTSKWHNPDNIVSCIQNLINGCLQAQPRGVYSMEDSAILWSSITFIVEKQRELRSTNSSNINALSEHIHEKLSELETQS